MCVRVAPPTAKPWGDFFINHLDSIVRGSLAAEFYSASAG